MTSPWRVAVYAAPGFGSDPVSAALRERADAWLGRTVDGRPCPVEAPDGWTRADVDAITVAPRGYGFHGTLKAPFHLAPGRTTDDLSHAVDELAATLPPVSIADLTLARLGSFLALVPGTDHHGLRCLAESVVTGLDDFRAPLTDAERARRNPAALTVRQRELLERWGYPYVCEEFRFHLTLTDSLVSERHSEVNGALRAWFAPLLTRDVAVDALAVFVQPVPDAPFTLHSAHPLAVLRHQEGIPR